MIDEQQQPETRSSESQTPGDILRQAREFLGYKQAMVAERLRLSLQTIIDIENDDYTHFAAEIYLRGYLRSYARLCHIDPELVLKAYEDMDIEIHSNPQIPVMITKGLPISNRVRRTKHRALGWAGFTVLFILIVMVVLWWQEQQRHLYSQKLKMPIETSTAVNVKPAAETLAEPLAKPVHKKTHSVKSHKRKLHVKTQKIENSHFVPDYSISPVNE